MRGADGDEEGVEVGGVLEFFPEREFLFSEAVVVVVACELDGGVLRGMGLDDDLAEAIAAPGASGDLGEELKGAFAGAKVRHMEAEIGVENSDEGDIGEVEAFGDHLCAEKDLDFSCFEIPEGITEFIFAAHAIGIDAGDPVSVKFIVEEIFNFLGAVSGEADGAAMALGAFGWRDLLEAADVAEEFFVGAMEGKGDGAVSALAHVSAFLADEGCSETAAVEEEDDLFVLVESFENGDAKVFGKEGGDTVFFLAGFVAHIGDADEG